jgi:hypothetical protein
MRTLVMLAVAVVALHSALGQEAAQFVFVRIPQALQPLERAAKYEDPLNAALTRLGVGEVSGGGSQLSEPDKDGKRYRVDRH